MRTITGVTIRAISTAVPENQATQGDFAELFGEKEVERIVQGTGIKSIREAGSLTTTDLVVAACRNLVERGQCVPESIDGLIVVTQTPDAWSPGVGYAVHRELGLAQDCLVLDVSAGCSGYISALIQAGSLIASGACANILVCTGDVTTKLIDNQDRHVKMLLGDAASATLLSSGNGNLDFVWGTDGTGYYVLGTDIEYCKKDDFAHSAKVGRLHMDGTAVMNFALSRVPAMIKRLLKATGLELDSLDMLVMHQANAFMLNYLRRMIGIDSAKMPVDVDGIGNTSSTSIPLVLSRHDAIGTDKARQVVLCGFGAGLSWGGVRVDMSNTIAVRPVFVHEQTVVQHD